MALGAQLRVDHAHHHVDVGDATVGDPGLGSVQHPLVGGLVVDGPQPVAADVGAGVGFAGAEGPKLQVGGVAVALGDPFHDLFLGAGGGDSGGSQRAAHDGHADSGIAPEQFLDGHRNSQPGLVAEHSLGQEVPAVQADLGRLLDDWIGELLPLVPFLGGRAHHVHGELVHPVA